MISSQVEWRAARAYKNEGGIEILVVLSHVLGIVFRSLSFVHGVEVELGVFVLDGVEICAQGFLDTMGHRVSTAAKVVPSNTPSGVDIDRFRGLLVTHRDIWSEGRPQD